MNEGWYKDEYFILFAPEEAEVAGQRYGIDQALPNHSLIGLVGWDEFILAGPSGRTWRVPTVPLVEEYREELSFDVSPSDLAPDDRLKGRIKWYITPVIFGGDPEVGENISWIDLKSHQELVRWWNQKYAALVEERNQEEAS